MKVGTDGVLIGAWARVEPGQERMLDVGAGTGLIALMLAQRSEEWGAQVDAVEIEPESCGQAVRNAGCSPWAERVSVYGQSIQEFAAEPGNNGVYGHIVSNPPYFINSLLPPGKERIMARHTSTLTYAELCGCAASLLDGDGIFSVIIPAESRGTFVQAAGGAGLFPVRECTVYGVEGGPAKRVMLELSRQRGGKELQEPAIVPAESPELAIVSADTKDFTPAYRELTKDFYLKF